jgi:hypothetical protein
MESKLDWSDFDGDAELAHAKRRAVITLIRMVENYRYWEDVPEPDRNIATDCILLLRSDRCDYWRGALEALSLKGHA